MSETDSPKDGPLEEAAAWFARMRGPDGEESRADFEKWLARGALHRRAYNRAAEVFAMGKLLADDEHENRKVATRATWREPRLLFGGLVSGVLLVLTAGWLTFHVGSLDRREPNALGGNSLSAIANVGEFSTSSAAQSIRLADRSLVRLGSRTSLAIQFDHAERRLRLERGSARFYVAHERRPFIVYAGGGYVVAHGTIFDVALAKNRRVTVGLVEGVVDVSAPAMRANHPKGRAQRRLLPGDTMSFTIAERASPVQDSRHLTGTRANLKEAMDYSSISLVDLVHLANEDSSRPIRIADETAAQRRVSGKFRIDDTEVLAQRIATLFNLRVDRSNPAEIVLSSN